MQSIVPRIDFYTAADGQRLAVRVWKATQSAESIEQSAVSSGPPPSARIVFLHGITSHGGWYHRSCRHLAAAGIEVHFLDRRGSGLNPHNRSDVDRYETWMSDVETYLESLKNSHVAAPLLAGISWGGKLAAAVARRRPELMSGLALICPGIYSYQLPGLCKRFFLSLPKPPRMRRRRVTIPLADPRLFTLAPPWVSFVADDPLSLRDVTIRFASEDVKLTRFARASASFPTLPLLLVLSGRDRIVDNAQTRAYFNRVTARSKRLIEYPAAAHTLEFEPDPQQYFDDLTEWICAACEERQVSKPLNPEP